MSVLRMLTLIIILYVTVTLLAFLLADRVIFQPPSASYAPRDFFFRQIPVGSTDSVAVVHLPNPRADLTILHSHGNAEDLGHVLPFLQELHALGFEVVSYDYRGYGRSSGGRATARKAAEDAEAVYRFTVDELGVGPDRLVLHGRSVGSGPTLQLAAQHDVAGIILESAFTSTYRVITKIGLLPFDRFPNLRNLRKARAPVLLIHGTRDRVIPFSHGMALFDLAREPKHALWVENAGHNDLVAVAGADYAAALTRFADGLSR